MDWDVAFRSQAELGEGPSWSEHLRSLLWVDILSGRVFVSRPADGSTSLLRRPHPVGAAVPRVGGGLALAVAGGFELFSSVDGGESEFIPVHEPFEHNRMNDAKCDPRGRMWAGTMDVDARPGRGGLYRLDAGKRATRMLGDLTVSNGLGWSVEGTEMYLIDTPTREMSVFDFDLDGGVIFDRRALLAFDPGMGLPDGMCVDEENGLWVAFYDGGMVARFGADGEETERVELPVRNPTSCCFGGEDYRELYVTSAALGTDTESEPLAGSVFRLEPGVRGMPTVPFAG